MEVHKGRICLHLFDLAGGGVERMKLVLANQLLARSFEVDLVLARLCGPLATQIPAEATVIDMGASRTLGTVGPLISYLKKRRPEVLLSSMGAQNCVSIIARDLARVRTRVYVTQHNALSAEASAGVSWQYAIMPTLYGLLLRKADGIIGVSKGVSRDLEERLGLPPGLVHTIYNPACPNIVNTLEPHVTKLRREHREPMVLAVGRLELQKDFDTLLRGFADLLKIRAARLCILGEGSQREALKARADQLGISDRVDLPGFQPNIDAYMRSADVFVLSSRYEGFANVIVEALAYGLPVVSTDCSFGPSEILADGKFGSLIPVGDSSGLAKAISVTLDSRVDSAALMKRAEDFSVSRVADEYVRVLGLQ